MSTSWLTTALTGGANTGRFSYHCVQGLPKDAEIRGCQLIGEGTIEFLYRSAEFPLTKDRAVDVTYEVGRVDVQRATAVSVVESVRAMATAAEQGKINGRRHWRLNKRIDLIVSTMTAVAASIEGRFVPPEAKPAEPTEPSAETGQPEEAEPELHGVGL
jgi:hypothetical protein